jgi:hypothetical protein
VLDPDDLQQVEEFRRVPAKRDRLNDCSGLVDFREKQQSPARSQDALNLAYRAGEIVNVIE